MEKLPEHAAFLQDVHDFLKSMREESLPELMPMRALYEIYVRKMGGWHDCRNYYQYFATQMIFAACVEHILGELDTELLPYTYKKRCASMDKKGHDRIAGLLPLCQKYGMTEWNVTGFPNLYYDGILRDKPKKREKT